MTLAKVKKIKDIIINIFDKRNKVVYVTETNNWSVKWDGIQIVGALNNFGIKSRISFSSAGLKNKIIHFGSVNSFFAAKNQSKLVKKNNVILTWFHLSPKDERIKDIPNLNNAVNFVHTSCSVTKDGLVKNGLHEEKIIVIPLGVDLDVFRCADIREKDEIKKSLDLPKDKIIIGSFQKDGDGWGNGLNPKMIKGPDVFCDTVEKLAAKYPIHVLLTGPARGYVKRRLESVGISYTHKKLRNYPDIAKYYNCLDLYIISSRVEGGPKALLESYACGVPVVSTRMGMPADIIENGKNGLLAKVEDVDGLVASTERIINDKILRNSIIANSLEDIKKYDWKIIAEKYYDLIYKKL